MVTRISGLASGMDVDTLVKQMMTAKRVPLDKLNQQKQTLQWQRDNYREINSKLVDFRYSKLLKYDKSAEMNTQTAVVTGNTTALKAEATADANGVAMKMEITQLAKPRYWESAALPTTGTPAAKTTSSSKLSALTGANSATQTYSIVINSKTLDFDKDLTIAEVVSKINTSTAGATATFDEVSGKFSIASKTYGSAGELTIADSSSLLTVFGTSATTYTPIPFQTAEVTFNDSATSTSFDSNSFKLNGINITLLAKTEGSPATISTQSDSTKALDTITNFVKDYNELLSALQSKVDEERYKDYTPLTDEQKKDMTDSDITLWETKAKSGLLKNDSILKSTITSMRAELSKKIGDLTAIGITAGPYYENGKLHIDETVLKQAILDDPQKVTSIFQGSSDSKGLFDTLTTTVDANLDKIVTKAGTSKYSSDITLAYKTDSLMGKSLADYTTRITAFQDKLTDLETSYYKKFTSMETAMNKYNNQSSMITNFMAQ